MSCPKTFVFVFASSVKQERTDVVININFNMRSLVAAHAAAENTAWILMHRASGINLSLFLSDEFQRETPTGSLAVRTDTVKEWKWN